MYSGSYFAVWPPVMKREAGKVRSPSIPPVRLRAVLRVVTSSILGLLLKEFEAMPACCPGQCSDRRRCQVVASTSLRKYHCMRHVILLKTRLRHERGCVPCYMCQRLQRPHLRMHAQRNASILHASAYAANATITPIAATRVSELHLYA